MPDIDLEKALSEMINSAVEEPDHVSEIISVGTSDQNTTVGLYKTKGGRELGFEVSDGTIEVFTLKQP